LDHVHHRIGLRGRKKGRFFLVNIKRFTNLSDLANLLMLLADRSLIMNNWFRLVSGPLFLVGSAAVFVLIALVATSAAKSGIAGGQPYAVWICLPPLMYAAGFVMHRHTNKE
jgi:hypothetical protein